jgi:ACR3 family arsenite transporter
LLLGVSDISVPYLTVALSVIIFVLIPFLAGFLTRALLIRWYGITAAVGKLKTIESKMEPLTMIALLGVLVITFIFQGSTIVDNWAHILLIAVPYTIQTFGLFGVSFGLLYWLRIPFELAAPAAFISTSNFFELAVAVAISSYGLASGAALATVVGVLTEVPYSILLDSDC